MIKWMKNFSDSFFFSTHRSNSEQMSSQARLASAVISTVLPLVLLLLKLRSNQYASVSRQADATLGLFSISNSVRPQSKTKHPWNYFRLKLMHSQYICQDSRFLASGLLNHGFNLVYWPLGQSNTQFLLKPGRMESNVCTLEVLSNLVSRWREVYSFWGICRDIHIECSKQFKWYLYFYGSGLSRPF